MMKKDKSLSAETTTGVMEPFNQALLLFVNLFILKELSLGHCKLT